MSERIVLGPCLTRAQAARRAGVAAGEVRHRPDLLRLGGEWLEETYFAFQFDESGVRTDIGQVVQSLRGAFGDEEIADWLSRPNSQLDSCSPLSWLRSGSEPAQVVAAAREAGPVHDAPRTAGRPPKAPPPRSSMPAEGSRRRYRRVRLAAGH